MDLEHLDPDAEVIAHEQMTRVKIMRIWKNIETVYASGKLSSRITTHLPIQWDPVATRP